MMNPPCITRLMAIAWVSSRPALSSPTATSLHLDYRRSLPPWIHALVRSLQNISCFMQPVNYRQDHSLPDCLLARLQD
jgi:hypothetical protein